MELLACPKCKQITVETLVYSLPFRFGTRDLEKTLKKYSLNSITEYKCKSCGFTYN